MGREHRSAQRKTEKRIKATGHGLQGRQKRREQFGRVVSAASRSSKIERKKKPLTTTQK